MRFKNQGVKFLFAVTILFSPLLSNTAHADVSYGAKFVLTTAAGCAAGGVGTSIYASQAGYDSQPQQTLTWMGAASGCLTGAIFSYFFYNDDSAGLQTKVSEQQKTIQDLSLQLASMQGQKQNGTFYPAGTNTALLPNPFNHMELKEGVAKSTSSFDTSHLPKGLNIKNCNKLWQYSLAQDGSEIENSRSPKYKIVAVNKNFALVGFTFLYSPNDCFYPSSDDGVYAENYFSGLTNFLTERVKNWNAEHQN